MNDPRFEVKWSKKSGSTPPSLVATESAQPDDAEVDELRRRLDAEQERTRNLQDRWQRAAADLVNLRKRTEQEQAEKEKFAAMLLVYELLPALDNFERALGTIPGNLGMLTWFQGVMLIERQLRAILEQRGLAPIEAGGQTFNPTLHEAIADRETEDSAPGTIVHEYQRGYTMHGRVIRPSLVEVSRAPILPEPDAREERSGTEEMPAAQAISENVASAVFVADPEAAEEAADTMEESQKENVGP
ncbi:MAG: nucleotide exchange factor GrpE [Chloroflexota bacterium]